MDLNPILYHQGVNVALEVQIEAFFDEMWLFYSCPVASGNFLLNSWVASFLGMGCVDPVGDGLVVEFTVGLFTSSPTILYLTEKNGRPPFPP
jgi:hypothetical protein